jgi:L-ascorbate metabolism protein UlaG (beta-lactamase superfamily)
MLGDTVADGQNRRGCHFDESRKPVSEPVLTHPKFDFGRRSAPLDAFCAETCDGLFYLSHASILVRLNGKTLLFDPVLAKPPHLGSWLFYPEMEMDRRMLEVDAVLVSHQHQDHYDAEFLKMLPATTPIYILDGRPQFAALLEGEGIAYTLLPAETLTDLGDGIQVIGINHEYNGIDAALAVSNGQFTVYHGNDCFVSNDKLDVVLAAFPRIDVACIPFAYVHWYPFLLEEVDEDWKGAEATRLIDEYLDYGLRQTSRLNPAVAIPFGANMFYADDIYCEHNKAVLSPFDFKDYADRVGYPLRGRIAPLFAGDAVYSRGPDGARSLAVVQRPFDRQALFEGFNRYLRQVTETGVGLDLRDIQALSRADVEDHGFIADRIAGIDLAEDHVLFISNADQPDWGVVAIDLKTRRTARVDKVAEGRPYHHFRLNDLAYKAYFSQAFTFNEIVASSQFKLVRRPNLYNLEVLKIINNVL